MQPPRIGPGSGSSGQLLRAEVRRIKAIRFVIGRTWVRLPSLAPVIGARNRDIVSASRFVVLEATLLPRCRSKVLQVVERSIGPNSPVAARLNTSRDELEASRSVLHRWQVARHRIRWVSMDFLQNQIRSIRVKIGESFNVSFRMTGWHASRVSRYSVCTWSAPCNGTRCLTGCR
jgi:hypothetical protein